MSTRVHFPCTCDGNSYATTPYTLWGEVPCAFSRLARQFVRETPYTYGNPRAFSRFARTIPYANSREVPTVCNPRAFFPTAYWQWGGAKPRTRYGKPRAFRRFATAIPRIRKLTDVPTESADVRCWRPTCHLAMGVTQTPVTALRDKLSVCVFAGLAPAIWPTAKTAYTYGKTRTKRPYTRGKPYHLMLPACGRVISSLNFWASIADSSPSVRVDGPLLTFTGRTRLVVCIKVRHPWSNNGASPHGMTSSYSIVLMPLSPRGLEILQAEPSGCTSWMSKPDP